MLTLSAPVSRYRALHSVRLFTSLRLLAVLCTSSSRPPCSACEGCVAAGLQAVQQSDYAVHISGRCVSDNTKLVVMPGISSLLQSILHMEVVLSMSIAQHNMQPSPMLQQLLLHAGR